MIEQYKGLKREIYVLSFGRLVTGLGSMIWPMMTLILSQKMNISAGTIAWLLAAAMIIMMPAVYVGGKITDSRDKKMTIVILDLISVACFFICAFIPLSWISLFLIFIGSVCQNMEHPAYAALMADITLTKDRDRAYSLQYLCANLGLVLAPTISGFLFKDYLWLSFLINSFSILSSTVLIFFLVKDTVPVIEQSKEAVYQKERSGESIWHIMHESQTILIFLIVMCGYYAVYQMFVYLMPLDMAEIHGDRGAVLYGSVTSVNCIAVVLFTPAITKLSDKRPEPDRITAGVALLVSGFALFAVFEGVIPMYYISMVVLTWGEIFTVTSENAYLSRRVPSSHRGQINGVFTIVRTAAIVVFQLLTGYAYEKLGSDWAWIFVVSVGVICIALSLVCRQKDRSEYSNLYI